MEFHHHHQQQEDDEHEEMPLPINSTYGHNNHTIPLSLHHHHHHPKPPQLDHVSTTIPPPPPSSSMEDNQRMMMIKVVKYKECLKNHAASIGGKATDGCGEFMPCGEDGLICAVCNCHRNFHRKEIEGDPHSHTYEYNNYLSAPAHFKRFDLGNGRNLILQKGGVIGSESLGYNNHDNNNINNAGALVAKGPTPMIMSYNMGMGSFQSESDDQDDTGGVAVGGGGYLNKYPPPLAAPLQQVMKKRFRTKFTQEQKEKMVDFAEKAGWKIQRQEDSVVQEFCQELGIKRRVLKVWMHNNKQNHSKNNNSTMSTNPTQEPN
ncbi:zinc-finger homeodomain protein 3-like [Rutidosis leptorrhynchoides]|uniref:zinc-finger homeodomain protein 3-like n=1 Tax=Rutidosis leptorrhynchoides TaxID=125765 RepID=UPI003A995EA4